MTFVVQKVGLRASGPAWFAAGRVVIAAAVLLPAVGSLRRLDARGHAFLIALALTNVAGFLAFQLAGLSRVEAGTAATIVYAQPLLVLLGARWFLGERASRAGVAGAILGFAGVAVVGVHQLSVGSPLGVGLLLASAASWAAGTLLLKLWIDRPLLPLVAAQNLYGAVPLILLAAATESPPHLTVGLTLSLLYAGLLGSAVGWLLLALLLRRGDAGTVSSYIFLVPILGALFGVLLLGEPAHVSLVVGVALVAVGVRLVAVAPRSPS